MEDQTKSFYTIFSKVEKNSITYLYPCFNKVIFNLLNIKIACLKYYKFFPSKLKLYKNIKAGFVDKVLLDFFAQPYFSLSVIVSKATQ